MTSEYPVILSFENHCSKKQQERIARHCDRILGNLLLSRQIDGYPVILNIKKISFYYKES